MNDVIDQRTVEMRFDKSNFEKNVESTLGIIDRLKQSLNFKESARGIEVLENSFSNLNLQNVKRSAEAVSNSFDGLFKKLKDVYVIKSAADAFTGLNKTIENAAKSMLQINQMKSGWDKYTMKTKSVQTIMNATGKSIDEVTAALNKLNWYTDETSYDFADMVNNIGKFTSSGVDLKDAVTAMQGISNWAASSGQDVQQAGRAMYNLSQALSMGAVKMQDWRSIELANMGTVEFKNTVLETGVALGKLTKTGEKYYTKIGKKQEVTTKNFSSTLSTGWFDSELLVATLKRYSEFTDEVYKFMDEHPDEFDTVSEAMEAMRTEALKSGKEFDSLGYKWFKAAQEAKSFEEAVNSVKDAVSTGWMQTFEYIFGNYEQARDLFTEIANDLYPVFASSGEKRNDFLHELLVSNYSKLKEEILDAGLSVEEFEKHIYDSIAADELNQETLDRLILKYGSLSKAIEKGALPRGWIDNAISSLAGLGEEASSTFHTFEEVEQIIKDTWNSNKYGVGEERFQKYRELGYDAQALQKLVDIYGKKGKITLEDLAAVGIEAGESYSETWKDFIDGNRDLIDSLDELSGRDLLIGSLQNVLSNVFKGTMAVTEGIESIFSVSPESARRFLENLYNLTKSFKLSADGAEKLKNFTSALVQPIKSVSVVGKKFIDTFIGDSFDNAIPKIQKVFGKYFDVAYTTTRRVAKVFKSLEDSAYVNKAANMFSEAFHNAIDNTRKQYGEYSKAISELFSETYIGSGIKKYVTRFKNIWNELNTGGQNAFDTLVKTVKEFKKQWISDHGPDYNYFSALWEGIKGDFEKFKSSNFFKTIRKPFDIIREKINNLFSKNSNEIIDTNRIKFGIRSKINTIKDTLFELFNSITGIDLQKVINGVILFSDPKLMFKSFLKSWNMFVEGFDSIIPAFFSAKKVFSIAFKSGKNLFQSLSDGYKEFLLSFAENVTGGIFDRTNINAFENAKKLFISNFKSNFEVFLNGIKQTANKIVTKAISKRTKKSKISEFIEKYISLQDNGFPLPNLQQLKDSLQKRIFPTMDLIDRIVNDTKKEVKTKLSNAFQFDFIKLPSFSEMISNIRDKLSKIRDGINGFLYPSKTQSVIQTGNQQQAQSSNQQQVQSSNQIIAFLEDAKTKIGNFWTWAKPLMKTMAETFAKSFNLQNLAAFINALSGFNLTKTLGSLKKVVETYKFSNVASSLRSDLQGLIDAFSPLKDVKKELKARSVMEFAIAIGIVAGAIFLIAAIPEDDLLKAGKVIGAISVALLIMGGVISNFGNQKLEFALSGTGQVLKIIGLILSIGIALRNAGKAAKGIAEAVDLLVGSVEKLSDLSVDRYKFHEGLKAVQDLVLALGGATFAAGFLTIGNIFGGSALTILSFAASIRILYDAIEKITALSMIAPDNLKQSIESISQIINQLGHASFWAGFTNGSWKDAGAAETILAMAAAIEIIQNAVLKFESIPKKRLRKAVDAISEILSSLGEASFWSGFLSNGFGGFGRAATILAFGKTIEMFVGSVASIMSLSINPERFEQSKDVVISIMRTLEDILNVMGVFNLFGARVSISQAAAVIGFGITLKLIAGTLEDLGKMNRERLVLAGNTVAQIGVLIAGFTAVLGVINRHFDLSIKELGSAAMIVAFGTAISSIAGTVIKLGEMDQNNIEKGLWVTARIGGIVATLTAVSSMFEKGAKFSSISFFAIATGILLIGQAIEKLGGMDEGVLKKGGLAVIALSGAIAACIALMNLGAKVPSWTNAVNIAALAAAVWILADAAKKFGDLDTNQLLKAGVAIAALLGALTWISRKGLASGNIGTLLNSVSLLVLAGAVSLLAQVAKSFADFEWEQMVKIGLAMAGMTVGIIAIGNVLKAGATISLGSIGKFGIVVAAIGGILTVLGLLMKIDGVSELMTGGGDFLGKIGSALGKFIGGIGGGIGEAMAASLPAIGSSLAGFAENAKPFFDLIQGINGLDVGDILLSLVASEQISLINEGLGRFLAIFNGGKIEFKTLEAFGTGLSSVAPGVQAFIDATSGADASKITAVATAMKEMARISRMNLGSDGENNPLADFAAEIVSASASIEEAVNALNGLPGLTDNANTVIESLIKFANTNFSGAGVSLSADMNAGLGNLEEGVLPYFQNKIDFVISFGNGLKEYIEDLKNSTQNISDFVGEVNKITFEYDEAAKKTKLEVFADALSKFADIDLPTGSLFYNQGAFGRMASDLVGSFDDVKLFANKINEDYTIPDQSKLDSFIGIIERMASIVMPGNPYATGSEGMFMTAEQLVETYAGAASQIGIIAEEIEKEAENFDIVSKLVDILNLDEKTLSAKVSENGIPKLLKTFVDNLNNQLKEISFDTGVTTGLQSIADILSPIEGLKELGFTEVAADITSGISKLSSINQDNGDNELLTASETINAFATFARRVKSIQNDFNDTKFADAVGGILETLNEKLKTVTSGTRTNMKNIREFFDSVMDIYSDKYHFETSAPNKFGTLISSLVEAIDLFSPKTPIDDLKAYTDWMEDLSGKQSMFESAGKAISAFAVDTNKLNSVTSFISALKGEFNFAPGDSNFVTNPGETGGHWEKLPGYFSKIADDIVEASNILKGTEDQPTDFAEFDMITNKFNKFASAMKRVIGTSPEELGAKIRQFIQAINAAILGDSSEENPGIKDFGDRLSQFDKLEPVFSRLESYSANGLKDVVPNILTGITNAINNFSFDPAGIDLIKTAIANIKEALDQLTEDGEDFDFGVLVNNPKGALGSVGNSILSRYRKSKADEAAEKYRDRSNSERNKVSKVDELIEKIQLTNSQSVEIPEDNIFTSFADAINNLNIDETKINLLTNVADSLVNAANATTESNPGALADFVNVIGESIIQNRDITNDAATKIVEDVLTVLENFMQKFFDAGSEFIKNIAGGMEATPDAVEMAATMATRILTQFSLAAQQFGGEKGKEMLTSVLDGFSSEESKAAINSAFDSLFGGEQSGELQLDAGIENTSIGTRVGGNFAKDFMQGFTSNLMLDEDSSFAGMFQSVTDMFSGISSMDGNSAGMEFGTFLTDFSESISEIMSGDAGAEIQTACDQISSVVSGSIPDGHSLGYSFVEGIRDGLLQGIADFGAEIAALAGQLGSLMNNSTATVIQSASPSKTAMRLGGYFVEGLKLGIEKNVSSAYGAGESVGNAAVNGTQDTLGIHSPSKVLYEIGEYAVDGFTKGVHDTTGSAVDAMSGMANLSVDEAMKLINLLQSSNYPIYSKGRVWQKSDIGYLQQYIASIQNATAATENYSKKVESSTQAVGEVQSGASGGGKAETSSEKTSGNILKTEVKGTELAINEIGTIIKGLVEKGGSFEYGGTKYTWSDIPKEFVSKYKDYFNNVFGNYDGFTKGLETFIGIGSLNVKGTTAVGNKIDHLSSVFEMGSAKVGLTKDAAYMISDAQSGGFTPDVSKMIEQTARSMKREAGGSVKSGSSSGGTSSGGNTYNFNQQIIGSKAASRAEIYRQTKNQFAQLKSINSKVVAT